MAGPIICFILRLLAVDPAQPKPHLKTAAVAVEWILRCVPLFCFGRGLLFSINIAFFEIVEARPLTIWSSTVAYDVILLGVESVIYILVTIQVDILSSRPKAVNTVQHIMKCLCLRKRRLSRDVDEIRAEDVDVKAENERISSGEADNDLIVLKDLTKKYSNGKLAVDGLSLGISPGQCFGLLGINGAGR